MNEQNTPSILAAIDLGSNSFHMVVARETEGRIEIIDRMRERVALASALDERRLLSDEGTAKAVECLTRFAQRLRSVPRDRLRVVGTSTLRRAKNVAEFLGRAERALGHPIEVISGKEEARLIYSGVVHGLPQSAGARLVIDIGGGSTEMVLGKGRRPVLIDSFHMGCLVYTQRFFTLDRLREKQFESAVVAAETELLSVAGRYLAHGWDECVGSSGTMVSVASTLQGMGQPTINEPGLESLVERMLRAKRIQDIEIEGLSEERRNVLPGGLAILLAIFRTLRIESIVASPYALREGILYDIVGRIRHRDARDESVRRMVERFSVDTAQASRVLRTATTILDQVAKAWKLDAELSRQYLSWATQLHEIGLSIAYGGYHKHSAYLAQHCDLPGFSYEDQQMLAFVLLNHRRKIRLDAFPLLNQEAIRWGLRLCVILRLAVLFNRSREGDGRFPLTIKTDGARLSLGISEGWLRAHPMTEYDLQEETARLREIGTELVLS